MILAAGSGTRLHPLTNSLPKCTLPVAGKPCLEWIVERLVCANIRELVINLHRHADAVVAHFGDGKRYGVSIRYSLEEQLLGTAGAIRRALPLLAERFVVIYGDVLTDAPAPQPDKNDCDVKLWATKSLRYSECGVLHFNAAHRITGIEEKPMCTGAEARWVFAGTALLSSELVARTFPVTGDLMGNVLPPIITRDLAVVEVVLMDEDTSVVDIGTPEGYCNAQHLWA